MFESMPTAAEFAQQKKEAEKSKPQIKKKEKVKPPKDPNPAEWSN